MFGFLETFDIAATLTLILSRRFGCSSSASRRRGKLFAQKRRGAGCHRKHDWRIQTCVCVCVYIYIYKRALLLEFDDWRKKSGVCVSFCAFLRRQNLFVGLKTCRFLHQKNNSFLLNACVFRDETRTSTTKLVAVCIFACIFSDIYSQTWKIWAQNESVFRKKRESCFCCFLLLFCSYTRQKRTLLPNEEIPQHARDI